MRGVHVEASITHSGLPFKGLATLPAEFIQSRRNLDAWVWKEEAELAESEIEGWPPLVLCCADLQSDQDIGWALNGYLIWSSGLGLDFES